MYFGLRPELRAAQRVLRPLRSVKRPYPTLRITTIRSFSSHLRLLKDTNSPDTQGAVSPLDATHSDAFAHIEATVRQQILEESKDPQERQRWLKNFEREDAIRRGEVPAGHSIAATPADLPKELEHVGKDASAFPAFYVSSPGYEEILPIRRIPKDFPGLDGQISPLSEPPKGNGTSAAVDDLQDKGNPSATRDTEHDSKTSTLVTDRSRSGRRKRFSRRSRSAVQDQEELEIDDSEVLPAWFVRNNIHTQQDLEQAQTSTHEELQKPTPESAESVRGSTDAEATIPETDVRIEADGSSGSSSGDSPVTQTPSKKEHMMPLADGRYYVHQHQYTEVSTVLKGILHRSPDTGAAQDINAMRHLALFHTAKDADLLLDALVKQLCTEVNAAYVKVDVQDIADFVFAAAAEPHPEVLVGVNKMSYGIYNSIYGRQEASSLENDAREEDEDEDDNDNDNDDEEDSSNTIDFSTVVALPIEAMGQGRGISSVADLFSRANTFMSKPPRERVFESHVRALAKMVDSYANAVIDTAVEMVNKDTSTATNTDQDVTQKQPPRPVIIQLPTYCELNDYTGPRDFRHSLIVAADKRSAEGQPIIVVGTDALRDLSFLYEKAGRPFDSTSTIQPQKILAEQGAKSGSATTAMMLTPCLPDKQAEAALVQDRKNRIRDVNVRHLHQALKRKGIALKGLEDGFWASDYTAHLGEKDSKMLSQHLMRYLEVERLSSVIAGLELSQTPVTDAVETIKKSDDSKIAWARELSPSTTETSETSSLDAKQLQRTNTISRVRSTANKYEQKLMTGVIEPKKITTTFSDIHIPTETVDALQTLTSLSLEYPEAFKYGVLKSDRIPGLMLYGPPGTGKTLAAKAVAKESGATMLEVSAADLYDMYVGEGEKNIRALFSLARKLSPCVVFIDEADSLFSKRQERSTKSNHRELLNQFLKEWDGMSNDAGSAFIMVATNRPMDMDDAVLRRLPRRLLVDLPTESDRLEILKIHLRNETLAENVNLADLAKKTPFYSGSDLKNLAVAAALLVVREQHAIAKAWQKDNPDSSEKYKYPTTRTITQSHFDKALLEISASISEDMSSLKDIKKFDEQYGDRKGRKKKSPKWGFKSATEMDKVLDTVKVRS